MVENKSKYPVKVFARMYGDKGRFVNIAPEDKMITPYQKTKCANSCVKCKLYFNDKPFHSGESDVIFCTGLFTDYSYEGLFADIMIKSENAGDDSKTLTKDEWLEILQERSRCKPEEIDSVDSLC